MTRAFERRAQRMLGEPDAEIWRAIEPLERSAQAWQDRARVVAAPADPGACISVCK